MPPKTYLLPSTRDTWTDNSRWPAPRFQENAPRSVRPEILDRLPQDSRAALASRRDLRLINRLQGNARWFRHVLRAHYRNREYVLELGAGTGELGQALQSRQINLAGLDLGRRPRDWPTRAPWFETDVLKFLHWADYPIVIGNLFFHHFDHAELATLGARLSERARLIIASEPLRAPRTGKLFRLMCPLIRAHQVTRHDGQASIAAGFRHDELPYLLRLDPAVWRWRVQETWLGAYRLIAERRA